MPVRRKHSTHKSTDVAPSRFLQEEATPRDGLVILDSATGNILDANQKFATLLETNAAELVGKTLWDLPISNGITFDQVVSLDGEALRPVQFHNLHIESSSGQRLRVEVLTHLFSETGEGRLFLRIRAAEKATRQEDLARLSAN
jgi:PAS domain-containing protein